MVNNEIESNKDDLVDSLDLEWMILCDSAEVSNGKLYLLGGGWNRLTVNSLQTKRSMSIAAAVRVPWFATNQRHSLEFKVETEDGKELASVKGEFEVGRPPGIPGGSSQLAQAVLNIQMEIGALGQYVIKGLVNGQMKKRTTFFVAQGPHFQQRPPAGKQ
jgi:hypothetical protein